MTPPEAIGIGLGFLAIVAPDFWPKMPRPLSYTLAAVGLSWLTYSGIIGLQEYTHAKLQPWPLALIIAGAAFIALGIFWHIHRKEAAEGGVGEKTATSAQPAKLEGQIKIAVGCASVIAPMTIEAGKTVRAADLFAVNLKNGGGGLSTVFHNSGQPWKWPDDSRRLFFASVFRCDVTNYSPVPIFDFQMNIDMSFYEAISTEGGNGTSVGPLHLRKPWVITAQKIDVGASNAFDFYLINWGNAPERHVVTALMPKKATLRILGSTERTEVDLTVTDLGGVNQLIIWPSTLKDPPPPATDPEQPKSPPTPPRPDPGPQDKPKRTSRRRSRA